MSPPSESGATGQQYNLKWTNHTHSVLQTLSEHLQDELLVDVTLSCEGQFLKAHKVVLSSCSPYFMELFKVHQGTNPCIILNGFRLEILKFVLSFMYDGEVKVSEADLEELLIAAEALKIKGLGKVRRETNATENSSQESETRTSTPVIQEPESVPEPGQKPPVPTPKPPAPTQEPQKPPAPTQELAAKKPPSPVCDKSITLNPNKKRRKQSLSPMDVMMVRESSIERTINGNVYTEENGKMAKLMRQSYDLPSQNEFSDNKTVDRYGTKIPRPPNAFMIFANDFRKKLASQNLGESNKEISVRLGAMWKTLPVAKKDEYYVAAKKADEEHKARYPGYFYSPKEARIRKELRTEKPTKPTTASIAILKKDSSVGSRLSPSTNNAVYEIQDEGRDLNYTSDSSNDNLLIDD